MARCLTVLVAVIAIGFAALKYGVYERVYDNGLGMLSEPRDVFRVTNTSSLTGRTALVTGCKVGGIGFETALAMANAGAHVFVHTRSLDASRDTIAALLQRNSSLQLTPIAADLADLDDVVRMTRHFPNVPLDFLFLNAAVLFSNARQTTAQNIELMMGVNHVAHALLALRLLPQLRQAKNGARVVVVASDAYKFGELSALSNGTLESASPWHTFLSYGSSKLANVAFAVEFDRRFRTQGVRSVALHPGVISTSFRAKVKAEETFDAKLMVGGAVLGARRRHVQVGVAGRVDVALRRAGPRVAWRPVPRRQPTNAAHERRGGGGGQLGHVLEQHAFADRSAVELKEKKKEAGRLQVHLVACAGVLKTPRRRRRRPTPCRPPRSRARGPRGRRAPR